MKRLRGLGLTRSQLSIFVDCTKSNLTTGKVSFGGRSLHDVSDPARPNPYETVIRLVSETMAPFDEDGIIPLYGFGACSHACLGGRVGGRLTAQQRVAQARDQVQSTAAELSSPVRCS